MSEGGQHAYHVPHGCSRLIGISRDGDAPDSACHPSEVGEMSTSVLVPVYAPVRIGVPCPCVS